MKQPEDVIIKDFQKGIGDSPHTGFADIRNADLFSIPGIVRVNRATAKASESVATDLVKWLVKDPNGSYYALGDTGDVYVSTSGTSSWSDVGGNTETSATGNGMAIWKDYLFVARNALLDTYGPLSGATFTVTIASPAVFTNTAHGLAANDTIIFSTTGALPTGLTAGTTYYVISAGLTADAFEVSTSQGGSAVNTSGTQSGTHTYKAWKHGWQSLTTDSAWHPMWVGQDDILYIGNARYIASVQELTDFVPGTTATYTWTAEALDLPEGYRVKCLTELGKNLLIGTIKGTNSYGGERAADIFPWDRSSDSFDLPVRINDFGVHQMQTIGNMVYVVTGFQGSIYVTNGSNYRLLRKLPQSLVIGSTEIAIAGLFLNFFPGAITHHKNRIYFGVSSGSSGANNADALGVWSLGEDGSLTFEHQISTGTMDSDTALHVASILSIGQDQLLLGWRDNTTYGIDAVSSNRYTTYATYIISPFIQVGTALHKRTFQQVEIYLAKALAASQAIRVSYRKQLTGSFTTLVDATFATYGAVTSLNATAPITDAEFIQIKIEIDTSASTTPELKEIRLR